MRDLKSLAAGGQDLAEEVWAEASEQFARLFPVKLLWFLQHGYHPHEWQLAFHCADTNSRLRRYRHLVAGRRGGKTMSAAWEVLFYALFPTEFWRDAHSVISDKKLWIWVLTADHEVGRPARIAFQEALDAAGLDPKTDYNWNKTEKTITFINSGTFIQFKTADNPQTLRGAGLDILWIDEAAFIPTQDAWDVVRPALSDKVGLVITTTTPHGKNWFWEKFWTGEELESPHHFRVEYTSIDRPSFFMEEWIEAKKGMHPALFAQEYLASFDAMAGLTLNGDWLHYFTFGDKPDQDEVKIPVGADGRQMLKKYIGVDTSTGEAQDEFAIAVVGISDDLTQGFLLDYWSGKIQFPEQIEKIREWVGIWRPEMTGVEANAYQKVLVQMVNRMQGFPAVTAVQASRSKVGRFIAMAPLFKIGKFRIHKAHSKFIDQWISFDAAQKLNRDDILDAVEIALSTAGVMLPTYGVPDKSVIDSEQAEAMAQIANLRKPTRFDSELGSEG
jgi:phage terminase large subunit-like protein